MQINKYKTALVFFIFLPALLLAQQNTISPYSVFGIGETQPQGFALNNALGGLGVAMRTQTYLNPTNPASLSALNLTTFEAGMGGVATLLNNNTLSQQSFTSTLTHLSLGFPITDGFAVSGGLLPYSYKGFELSQGFIFLDKEDSLNYNVNHEGFGGINRAYANFGVKLIKGLSFGATASLFFGTLNQKRDVVFTQTTTLNRRDHYYYNTLDYTYDLGVQYQRKISNKTITLGATYFPESNLRSNNRVIIHTYTIDNDFETPRDTIDIFSSQSNGLILPRSYAIGLAFEEEGKWFLSGEVSHKEWSQMSLFNSLESNFKDETQVKLGVWWIPNFKDVRNYLNTIQYRAGFNFNNGKLSLSTPMPNNPQEDITAISLSFGVGLPMKRSKTTTNLGLEIGKSGTTNGGLIEEKHIKFYLSFTFNDKWFKKSKID